MNSDDPFEQKLASLRSRELPPEWRAEILARAVAAPRAKLTRPPKWLLAGWGVAWAAVITLHVMTPADSRSTPKVAAPQMILLQERSQTLYALLNPNIDFIP